MSLSSYANKNKIELQYIRWNEAKKKMTLKKGVTKDHICSKSYIQSMPYEIIIVYEILDTDNLIGEYVPKVIFSLYPLKLS